MSEEKLSKISEIALKIGKVNDQLIEFNKKKDEKADSDTNASDFFESLFSILKEFGNAIKELKKEVIFDPIINIPEAYAKVRTIVRSAFRDERLPTEELLDRFFIDIDPDYNPIKLSADELMDLTDEHFINRYGQYSYFIELYEIGPMIVSTNVPKTLEDFVWEARECFALYRHVAVCSLCRTTIEIAIKDICARRKLFRPPEKSSEPYREHKLDRLINTVTRGRMDLRSRLHDIRKKTNDIIHGDCRIISDCPEEHKRTRELLRQTMETIEDLYDYHFGPRNRLPKTDSNKNEQNSQTN